MKNNSFSVAALSAAYLVNASGNVISDVLHKSLGLTANDLAKARVVLSRMPENKPLCVFSMHEYLIENGWVPASAAYVETDIRPALSVTGVPTVRVTRTEMTMLRKQLERGYSMHSGWGQTVWAATLICRALDWPHEVIVSRNTDGKAVGIFVQRTDVPQLPKQPLEGWTHSIVATFDPKDLIGA